MNKNVEMRGMVGVGRMVLIFSKPKIIPAISLSKFERGRSRHTYLIGHYNPSVRIIDLVSQTTYVVCVILMHKWGPTV